MRTLVVLLLASCFLTPTGAAATATSASTADDLAAWPSMQFLVRVLDQAHSLGFMQQAQQPALPDLSAAGQGLDLWPLGDINDDGRDDVAAVQSIYPEPEAGEPSGHVRALLGPSLAETAWDVALTGADVTGAGDVDGDGRPDVVRDAWEQITYQSQSAGAVVGGASTGSVEWQSNRAYLDARDGSPGVTGNQVDGYTDTEANVYGVVASGSAGQSERETKTLDALGNGTYVALTTSTSEVQAYGYGPVFAYTYGGARKLTADFLDATGTVRGSATVSGPLDNLMVVVPGDLDTTPGQDLVVTATEDAAPYTVYTAAGAVYGAGTGSFVRVEAWAGSSGTTLWSKRYDPVAAYYRVPLAIPAGDFNGDGVGDVEIVDLRLTSPVTVSERLELLSGADGSLLFGKDFENGYFVGLPFGDVDRDGKDELLALQATIDLVAGEASTSLAVVRASDLGEIWNLPLTEEDGGYIVNSASSAVAYSVARMTDWTGDQAPDLVFASRDSQPHGSADASEDVRIRAFDGKTGAIVMDETFSGLYMWITVDDVTGLGEQDLVVVLAPGLGPRESADFSVATVTAILVAGETGESNATAILRDVGAASAYSTYDARNLGNLDGMGGPEWGIHVIDEATNPYDPDQENDDSPSERWLLFAGTPGAEPIVVETGENGAVTGGGEKGEPGIGPLAAPAGSEGGEGGAAGSGEGGNGEEDGRKTPGLALVGLLIGLGAAVLIVRRR